MSRKFLFHSCVLLALIGVTVFQYTSAEKVLEELGGKPPIDVMLSTALPLFGTILYIGLLVVIYLLPAAADKVTAEIYGSSAKMEEDPLDEARAAVARGDYPEAIRIYRQGFKLNPKELFPMIEIAKIQRENLECPEVAVETLREVLGSQDWEEEETARLMFLLAEIYEEDLKNRNEAIATLKQVRESLPETRYAMRATRKLRELGVT